MISKLQPPDPRDAMFVAIKQCISASGKGALPLLDIYNYLRAYHWELIEQPSWKNSVRHKLSNDRRYRLDDHIID